MKQFLAVSFGGLAIIGLVWGGAKIGPGAWQNTSSLVASVFSAAPTDGTAVSGAKRYVRYSANEEEDLISTASAALANGNSEVSARSYIIKNLTSGTVIASRDADRLLPMASLAKLVTAEVARQVFDQQRSIPISPHVMYIYGNTAGFRIGETFTAHDLLYPLLMVSSNDAAEAYAQTYGRAAFIRAMNEFTQSIGAYRTYFADPSGLSPDDISSAGDITLILDYVRTHDPEVMSITMLKAKTVRAHTWINPAHFLNWSNYRGGKNGYTDEADRTGAALFAMGTNKETYAVVVLGSVARDADFVKLLEKVGK